MFRDSHIVRMIARFIFAFCAIYFPGVKPGQNKTVQRTAGIGGFLHLLPALRVTQ